MSQRLFGLETEYGIASVSTDDDGTARDEMTSQLLEHASSALPSLLDTGGRGLFLQNGARFYIDCGHHPEMTTPELADPWDAVRYILAGERILEQVVNGAEWNGHGTPILLKNNVDYLVGSTWGCHESILHTADPAALSEHLVPHLVSRVIYTGAGGLNPMSPGIEFVLSPRAFFLKKAVSRESTWSRGVFHTKDESLASGPYRRLHIICGESLSSEIAMWLRTAATVLVVAMAEGGVPVGTGVELADPVSALDTVTRDPACSAALQLLSGGTCTALGIQRHYLELAERHAGDLFMPPWAGTACRYWRAMLERLESAPGAVETTLDWGIKRALFRRIVARHGFTPQRASDWTEVLQQVLARPDADSPGYRMPPVEQLIEPTREVRAWMASVTPVLRARGLDWDGARAFVKLRQEILECDVRFSQLGGAGIFVALDRAGVLTHHVSGVDDISRAVGNPPSIGRARLRGDVIRRLQPRRERFRCGWTCIVDTVDGMALDLGDPFETKERWREETAQEQVATGGAGRWPAARRESALQCVLDGDYPRAEALLRALLNTEFDVQGTRCHLARVCVLTGRLDEARAWISLAWGERHLAPAYVRARLWWFQTMFAFMDGADTRPLIARIKGLVRGGLAVADWRMGPVMNRLAVLLPESECAVLTALLHVLDGQLLADQLEAYDWWRDATPVPAD